VPEYRVQEEGPDHRKEFTATVIVAGQDRGSGDGTTKKEAEQKAAEAAWRTLSEIIKAAAEKAGDQHQRGKGA
jgi:ribonuclease-3